MAKAFDFTKFRILHTADWHVSNKHLFDARECLDFMVKHAQTLSTEKPLDLIVIPGDIYDHRQIQQETEAARLAYGAVKCLADYAPVVILTGTPSHDGSAPLLLDDIGDRFPVLVVDRPSQWALYGGGDVRYQFRPLENVKHYKARAIISCAPAFTKQHFETGSDIATSDFEIAKAMSGIFANFGIKHQEAQNVRGDRAPVPHILLGHWSVRGANIHPSQPMIGRDIEISRDDIALANASIVCLGHIHAMQVIQNYIWYSGSLFATDFGEIEDKGFMVYDLEPEEWGRAWAIKDAHFVHTPSPKLYKLSLDFIRNPIDDVLADRDLNEGNDLLLQRILMVVKDIEEKNAIVRLEIKVWQDQAPLIDREAVHEYFEDIDGVREFKLIVNMVPRANVRSARIMEADRLAEKIEYRAEILGEELDPDILLKADALQDVSRENLLDAIAATLRKEKFADETAEN